MDDEIKKIHAEFVAEIRKRQLSSSENFDKSILAYSTGGLAFSLGFLKDFVPINAASIPCALYWSWSLFALASASTMISFLVSEKALAHHEKLGYAYYIEGNEEAFFAKNRFNDTTRFLNYFSGTSFLVGLVLTTIFISFNLELGTTMANNTRNHAFDGVSAPTMQKIQQPISQRGVGVPTMQKVPAPPANQTPPAKNK